MRAVVPVLARRRRQVVALVSVGITISRIDEQLLARRCSGSLAAALAVAGRRPGRRLAGQPAAAPADPRARRARDHPDVRVLRRGAARGPRGTAAARRRAAGSSWSTTRRAGCSTCPTTSIGRPIGRARPAAGARRRALGRNGRGRRRSTWPATGCWSSARRPRTWRAASVGAVVTLRDHTELQAVTGELDSVRGLAESLRAQNHESANRLHTVVSLIEMGRAERGVDFATEELRASPSGSPTGGRARSTSRWWPPCCWARAAQAAERGVDARHRAGEPSCTATADRAARPGDHRAATSSTTPSTRARVRRRAAGRGDPRRRRRACCASRRGQRARLEPEDRGTCSSAAGRPRPHEGRRPRGRPGPGRPGRPPARWRRSTIGESARSAARRSSCLSESAAS